MYGAFFIVLISARFHLTGGTCFSQGCGLTCPPPRWGDGVWTDDCWHFDSEVCEADEAACALCEGVWCVLDPTPAPSAPTVFPSEYPSATPSILPTGAPTHAPSDSGPPSEAPSRQPTHTPTHLPTHPPSLKPTFQPSVKPEKHSQPSNSGDGSVDDGGTGGGRSGASQGGVSAGAVLGIMGACIFLAAVGAAWFLGYCKHIDFIPQPPGSSGGGRTGGEKSRGHSSRGGRTRGRSGNSSQDLEFGGSGNPMHNKSRGVRNTRSKERSEGRNERRNSKTRRSSRDQRL